MYYGDISLGETIDIKFTTRRFTTGVPFALSGGVVAAYIDNGTTEITAGITLTANFDARTGLNNIRIVATAGNGYATGTNIELVLTAGTVDGVSVEGERIASFSIEDRSTLGLFTVINNLKQATIQKSSTEKIPFDMRDSSGALVTGATVSGQRSLDGGAPTAVTGSITAAGGGLYYLTPNSADTNANEWGSFIFTASGCIPATLHFKTSD